MKILALDIGTKRTGAAFIDQENVGFSVPLETINHASKDELLDAVKKIVSDRSADHLVLGLPYLLSGKDGSQAKYVRERAKELEKIGIPVSLIDERYSSNTYSPTTSKKSTKDAVSLDPNTLAAMAILDAFIAC